MPAYPFKAPDANGHLRADALDADEARARTTGCQPVAALGPVVMLIVLPIIQLNQWVR